MSSVATWCSLIRGSSQHGQCSVVINTTFPRVSSRTLEKKDISQHHTMSTLKSLKVCYPESDQQSSVRTICLRVQSLRGHTALSQPLLRRKQQQPPEVGSETPEPHSEDEDSLFTDESQQWICVSNRMVHVRRRTGDRMISQSETWQRKMFSDSTLTEQKHHSILQRLEPLWFDLCGDTLCEHCHIMLDNMCQQVLHSLVESMQLEVMKGDKLRHSGTFWTQTVIRL